VGKRGLIALLMVETAEECGMERVLEWARKIGLGIIVGRECCTKE